MLFQHLCYYCCILIAELEVPSFSTVCYNLLFLCNTKTDSSYEFLDSLGHKDMQLQSFTNHQLPP